MPATMPALSWNKEWYKPSPTRPRMGNTDLTQRATRAKGLGYRGHADRYAKDPEYQYTCKLFGIPRILIFNNTGNLVEPDEQ